MTDVSDVFINRDPFIFMKEVVNNNKLCIGTNVVGKGALKRTPEWFDRRKWKNEIVQHCKNRYSDTNETDETMQKRIKHLL